MNLSFALLHRRLFHASVSQLMKFICVCAVFFPMFTFSGFEFYQTMNNDDSIWGALIDRHEIQVCLCKISEIEQCDGC